MARPPQPPPRRQRGSFSREGRSPARSSARPGLHPHDRWPLERRAPRTPAWDVVRDLAIGVLSPTNVATDDAFKLENYFRASVRAVWVLYPSVSKVYSHTSPATVRILSLDDELDGGKLLPGLRIPIRALFGEPSPSS